MLELFDLIVKISGKGRVKPEPGIHENIVQDTEIKLKAESARGWRFEGWKGDLTGSDPKVNLKMNDNKKVTAVFIEKGNIENDSRQEKIDQKTKDNVKKSYKKKAVTEDYNFILKEQGEGKVFKKELVRPLSIRYPEKTPIRLKAEPDVGWKFSHWEGIEHKQQTKEQNKILVNTINIEIAEDSEVKAIFVPEKYSIDVNCEGKGQIDIEPDREYYYYHDKIKLAANPEQGFYFSHWEGDITGENDEVDISIEKDLKITAVFAKKTYNLTLFPERGGRVYLAPKVDDYSYGDKVKLTASTEPGFSFSHWTGDISGKEPVKEIEISENLEIIPVFRKQNYELDISVNGQGSIKVFPERTTYHYGERINVEAEADIDWGFSHWQGDLKGEKKKKEIFITGGRQFTAVFLPKYSIFTEVEGKGELIIKPDRDKFLQGTKVEVKAVPDDAWVLRKWSGDIEKEKLAERLYLEINEDRKIKAVFSRHFDGGKGTINDPYQIRTAKQLNRIRKYPEKHFIQVADIDLKEYFDSWKPVGDKNQRFKGTYDGNDCIINNLTINSSEQDYIGLFSFLGSNSLIENLCLDWSEKIMGRLKIAM